MDEELVEFQDLDEAVEFEDLDEAVEFELADRPAKAPASRAPLEFRPVRPVAAPEPEEEPWSSPGTPPTDQAATPETSVVRTWDPQADEPLQVIEQTIDGWGGRQTLDYDVLHQRVDKLTRRVGSKQVVVQETVTEWVDAPAEAEAPAKSKRAKTQRPKAAKRRPRILGFFGSKTTKKAVDKASTGHAKPTPDPDYQPQCAALTEDGAQCRNSARHGSKYCASHKGYQPPTTKGIAKRVEGDAWDPTDKVTDRSTVRHADTRPKVRKAKDTPLATRKPTRAKKAAKKAAKAAAKGKRKKR